MHSESDPFLGESGAIIFAPARELFNLQRPFVPPRGATSFSQQHHLSQCGNIEIIRADTRRAFPHGIANIWKR
jgi:hypothetical protein